MLEIAKITFFKIHNCGYYNLGPKPVRQFCDTGDLFAQLARWSLNKSLEQTITFTPADEDGFLQVYLFDVQQGKNEWLITLWNQTPATDNEVASVMANGSVGTAKVHMNKIQPGSIPGFATYFWVLPELDLIANVRFQHMVSGHIPMRSYLRGFIERFSEHVVYAPPTLPDSGAADLEIMGYRKNAKSDTQTDLAARFSTSIFVKLGDQKMLLEKVNSITKLLRRTTLELKNSEDLALWQRMWRGIKGTARVAQTDKVSVEYDLRSSVSTAELQDIFKEWESQTDKPTWDDFGFQLKGESNKTHWLSRSYAKESFEMEVTRQNAELVDGESLLTELHKRRKNILSLLD